MTAAQKLLERLGVTRRGAIGVGAELRDGSGPRWTKRSPIDGAELAHFSLATAAQATPVFEVPFETASRGTIQVTIRDGVANRGVDRLRIERARFMGI